MNQVQRAAALVLSAAMLGAMLSGCGQARIARTVTADRGGESTLQHSAELSVTELQAAAASSRPDHEELDKALFDNLVAVGPVASAEELASSSWATAVHRAGVLRVAGNRDSRLFSYFDIDDQVLRGFDAGLCQLLSRYILGDPYKFRLLSVTPGMRESVLIGGEADAVIATYAITRERRRVVDFAGPYLTTRQGLLIRRRGPNPITDLHELSSRHLVAVRRFSSAATALAQHFPNAVTVLYESEGDALNALRSGQVEAYADNIIMLLNTTVRNPLDFTIVSGEFGDEVRFGIGLPAHSDGKAFINAFLRRIMADGTWQRLWQVTIGNRTGISEAPPLPQPED